MISNGRIAEHNEIVKIAKQSPYTSDFSNRVMFSSDAAYNKGWIRIYDEGGFIRGFTCFRQKVTGDKALKLYFIGVHMDHRSNGIGLELLKDLKSLSHSGIIRLDVAKDNKRAVKFYKKHGFKIVARDALKGKAYEMKWEKDNVRHRVARRSGSASSVLQR